jgi:hypothetical protein
MNQPQVLRDVTAEVAQAVSAELMVAAPFDAQESARSRRNIAQWLTYFVATMVRHGWDRRV